MTMTATSQLQDAIDQLNLALTALDVRQQVARGHESHVPPETDAQIAQRIAVAVGLIGGGR